MGNICRLRRLHARALDEQTGMDSGAPVVYKWRPMPEEGWGQIRVLLVDDDELFLASLAALVDRQPELAVSGTVSDGVAALDRVEEEEPDAVVIDLHMPLLDGVSTVARLRRDRPSLCLIAITGDDAPALSRAAREAGADDVLLKSELVEGLVARLRATVRSAPQTA
jgi:DNA-binding NarL/FixJ family response regulator